MYVRHSKTSSLPSVTVPFKYNTLCFYSGKITYTVNLAVYNRVSPTKLKFNVIYFIHILSMHECFIDKYTFLNHSTSKCY